MFTAILRTPVLTMWRASLNIKVKMGAYKGCRSILIVKKFLQPHRSFSAAPPLGPNKTSRGGGGKIFLSLFGASALAIGGATAYATYDPNFRQEVEKTIPYSKEVFIYLLGEPNQSLSKPSEPVPQPKKEKIVPGAVKQEKKEAAPLEKKEKPIPSTKPALSPPTQANEKALRPAIATAVISSQPESTSVFGQPPPTSEKANTSLLKKYEDDELQERITKQEAEMASKNLALEKSLHSISEKCVDAVKDAVDYHKRASDAIKKHINALKIAMDEQKQEAKNLQWKAVQEAQEDKNKAVENASQKFSDAKLNLERLRNSIKDGKQSKATSTNSILLQAEEQLNKLLYDLETAASKVLASQSELKIVSDCKGLIDQGRQQLQTELDKLIPDIKTGAQKSKNMAEEELNLVLSLARQRIDQLQEKVNQLHLHEKLRLQSALDGQRQQDDILMQSRIRQELDKQRAIYDVEFQRQLFNTKDEFELELCQQLKRQAEAHRDHLADVIKAQQQELEIKFQQNLQEKIQEEKYNFQKQIAGSISRLRGIESALEARAQTERKARKAHELWLAVQSLEEAVKYGQRNAIHWEDSLRPLIHEVKAVQEAGDDHPFINMLMESFPKEAAARGVFPENALKERFHKVEDVCRRVAMVGENGGSLFLYALSYLQSLLIVDAKCNISRTDIIDPNKLDTFTILASVDYCLNKRDLEQAVRLMNQLHGEPRKFASDWLYEARLLLETQQVVSLLMAHVAAIGVDNIPHVQ